MNNLINNECSKCGKCCSNFLPLTTKEIKTMKRLAKKFKIKKVNDIDCPFLSNDHRCIIYKFRPMICKSFRCDKDGKTIDNYEWPRLKNCKIVVVSEVLGL